MANRTPIAYNVALDRHEPLVGPDVIDPQFIDIGVTGINGVTVTEISPNVFEVDATPLQDLLNALQLQVTNLQNQVDAFNVVGSTYIDVAESPAGTFTVALNVAQFCADNPCGP